MTSKMTTKNLGERQAQANNRVYLSDEDNTSHKKQKKATMTNTTKQQHQQLNEQVNTSGAAGQSSPLQQQDLLRLLAHFNNQFYQAANSQQQQHQHLANDDNININSNLNQSALLNIMPNNIMAANSNNLAGAISNFQAPSSVLSTQQYHHETQQQQRQFRASQDAISNFVTMAMAPQANRLVVPAASTREPQQLGSVPRSHHHTATTAAAAAQHSGVLAAVANQAAAAAAAASNNLPPFNNSLNPLLGDGGMNNLFNALHCFGMTNQDQFLLSTLQQHYLLQVRQSLESKQHQASMTSTRDSLSHYLNNLNQSSPESLDHGGQSSHQIHQSYHQLSEAPLVSRTGGQTRGGGSSNSATDLSGQMIDTPAKNQSGGGGGNSRKLTKFSINTILGRRSPDIDRSSSSLASAPPPPSRQTSARSDKNCSGDGGSSTALSSLSNFVTNSLAPIFGDDFLSSSASQMKHQQSTNKSTHSNNNNSSEDESRSSTSIGAAKKKSKLSVVSSSNSSPLKPAVAQAAAASGQSEKGAQSPTVATLAKAPLELVQKQPAWVFCTRYSDRPSSGPRTRRAKSKDKKPKDTSKMSADEKRPRTAFTSEQLEKLRQEFQANSYLDEKRRKSLAERLCLNENQIKIWFQNKRAKMKKQSQPNPLRNLLVAGGLYNHSTATSDCSESYVGGGAGNGLADDVGNRAMRDVEPDDDDDDEDDETTSATANSNNNDRFNNNNKQQRATTTTSNNKSSDHSSRSALDGDQDQRDNKQAAAQQPGAQVTSGPSDTKSAAAAVALSIAAAAAAASSALKRRRTSQSDGDDENEEAGENSSNPQAAAAGSNHHGHLVKRTKLNHMERNNNNNDCRPREVSSSPVSPPPSQSPALVAVDDYEEDEQDEIDATVDDCRGKSVTSVS